MTHLYEITEKHKELLALADESDDMAQAVKDTMESMEGEFDDKAVAIVTVVTNMGADTTAIDDEIKRLTRRKEIIKNKQENLREYLRFNMEETGISKIKCPLFTISLSKGRDVLEVTDVDKIPIDYMNIKTSQTPMKKDLLDALKAGEEIDGVRIVKSKPSLKIK